MILLLLCVCLVGTSQSYDCNDSPEAGSHGCKGYKEQNLCGQKHFQKLCPKTCGFCIFSTWKPEDKECGANYKTCANNKQCVPEHLFCDGEPKDCLDGSDEVDCVCSAGEKKCADNKQCVPEHLFCNGGPPDCADGSDEVDCAWKPCAKGYMKCADRLQCINMTYFCNGIREPGSCKDGKDEDKDFCEYHNKSCPPGYRRCADDDRMCQNERSWCNGLVECWRGEDEYQCKDYQCLSGFRKCANNIECRPERSFCDGVRNSCSDGSDEDNCP